MKIIYSILVCMMFVCQSGAQTSVQKFNKDKTFKIVQFTDVHYACAEPDSSQVALDCINNLPDGNGARVILLEEGSRTFTTWIRFRNGQVIEKVDTQSFTKE